MTNQIPSITILTAEDDPDDRILVQDAFLESGQVNTLLFVQDGNDLLQYLRRQGNYAPPELSPRPDLILLDLNMPHKDGRQSLAEIKSDPRLRSIPVVVLTASNSDEDILNTYNLGGAGFIIKPETFQGLVEMVKGLNQYWFEVVELANGERMNKIRYSHSKSPHPNESF
jgi:CheY-like chemotaxis protein